MRSHLNSVGSQGLLNKTNTGARSLKPKVHLGKHGCHVCSGALSETVHSYV